MTGILRVSGYGQAAAKTCYLKRAKFLLPVTRFMLNDPRSCRG